MLELMIRKIWAANQKRSREFRCKFGARFPPPGQRESGRGLTERRRWCTGTPRKRKRVCREAGMQIASQRCSSVFRFRGFDFRISIHLFWGSFRTVEPPSSQRAHVQFKLILFEQRNTDLSAFCTVMFTKVWMGKYSRNAARRTGAICNNECLIMTFQSTGWEKFNDRFLIIAYVIHDDETEEKQRALHFCRPDRQEMTQTSHNCQVS